jgi:uncharacterized SAM-binding protein YcdF (DUF218 family)
MSVDADARIVWDYHHMGHVLAPAECIIVLGSHDPRVAERAAEVWREGWAPLVVFSGNRGALTEQMWSRPEAEVFADRAEAQGVPRDRMLLEPKSTNTGENVAFSKALLAESGVHPKRVIAVQKPYMERRTWATFRQRWPEVEVRVTSPRLDFDHYPNEEIRKEDVIHIMVGDLQRIIVYGERAWQVAQEVPPEVREAYERLIKAGYDRRLIRDPGR